MVEASGSSTPSRSRTTTAASTGSQSTPSRISRMFSFGSSSGTYANRKEGIIRAQGEDDQVQTDLVEFSSSSASSAVRHDEAEDNATVDQASERRPSTPTPGARRGSQGGLTPSTNANTSTLQRRNSKSSFLSSILPSGAGPSGSSSQSAIASKGDPAERPGLSASKESNDASTSSNWKMPWSSPKKKPLQALAAADSQQQANSFGSVGLTMNGDAEEPETSPLIPVESNGSGGDVVDEGISMSDTSGKVGES